MSLGLPQHKVLVVPYDSEWPHLFQVEAERLQNALGDLVVDIQHIGSTSVPGLSAKPILDIAIAINDFEQGFDLVPAMNELGYIFRGEVGVPGRHFFTLGRPRTHHLHMYEAGSSNWKDRIAFRDRVRSNPAKAQEYAELKARLAVEFPNDISAYSAGKQEFIERLEKENS